mmetsp:Transcript_22287/g.58197  ORF Transcript_22287/g.58197 Transcript_22287/m.58197 type:complete len:293 (-) Transcript_22287:487-1365(-)
MAYCQKMCATDRWLPHGGGWLVDSTTPAPLGRKRSSDIPAPWGPTSTAVRWSSRICDTKDILSRVTSSTFRPGSALSIARLTASPFRSTRLVALDRVSTVTCSCSGLTDRVNPKACRTAWLTPSAIALPCGQNWVRSHDAGPIEPWHARIGSTSLRKQVGRSVGAGSAGSRLVRVRRTITLNMSTICSRADPKPGGREAAPFSTWPCICRYCPVPLEPKMSRDISSGVPVICAVSKREKISSLAWYMLSRYSFRGSITRIAGSDSHEVHSGGGPVDPSRRKGPSFTDVGVPL